MSIRGARALRPTQTVTDPTASSPFCPETQCKVAAAEALCHDPRPLKLFSHSAIPNNDFVPNHLHCIILTFPLVLFWDHINPTLLSVNLVLLLIDYSFRNLNPSSNSFLPLFPTKSYSLLLSVIYLNPFKHFVCIAHTTIAQFTLLLPPVLSTRPLL